MRKAGRVLSKQGHLQPHFHSKARQLSKKLENGLYSGLRICNDKINENLLLHFRFSDSMTICLKQICGYTDLCCEVEKLRKEAYSSDNATHEEKLMQV